MKASRNRPFQQESHQRDKHLGCHSCTMIKSILEMVNKGTVTIRPEDLKPNYDA